jgi:hypothetical protein
MCSMHQVQGPKSNLLVSGRPTAPTCNTDSRCWVNALPADQLRNAESIVASIAAAVAWEDYIVPRRGIDRSSSKHKKGQMLSSNLGLIYAYIKLKLSQLCCNRSTSIGNCTLFVCVLFGFLRLVVLG